MMGMPWRLLGDIGLFAKLRWTEGILRWVC